MNAGPPKDQISYEGHGDGRDREGGKGGGARDKRGSWEEEKKKKTPTQLRRERKKRQRERERRQRELEKAASEESDVQAVSPLPPRHLPAMAMPVVPAKGSPEGNEQTIPHPQSPLTPASVESMPPHPSEQQDFVHKPESPSHKTAPLIESLTALAAKAIEQV